MSMSLVTECGNVPANPPQARKIISLLEERQRRQMVVQPIVRRTPAGKHGTTVYFSFVPAKEPVANEITCAVGADWKTGIFPEDPPERFTLTGAHAFAHPLKALRQLVEATYAPEDATEWLVEMAKGIYVYVDYRDIVP